MGGGGHPLGKLDISPHNPLYRYQCGAVLTADKEYIMYAVIVQWGNTHAVHQAWTLASAKEWMLSYPNEDVFIKVIDMFGNRRAVRYAR